MSDQDFRERVLAALERLEQKFEQKFDAVETHLGSLEQGVSWIRGKIEGKVEAGAILWSRVAVGTAIVSAIIALFALLK